MENMVPYEVVDLNKAEFVHLHDDIYQKGDGVVLLPVEGKVQRTATGWVQILGDEPIVQFGIDEIVWKAQS